MELAIKGVLGALIAIGIHLATTGKHAYLAGVFAAAPVFAMFAHITLASIARTADLPSAAQLHLLSMIPNAVYLVLVWWLATRLNVWVALIVAILIWGIATFSMVMLWSKGIAFVANLIWSKATLVLVFASLIGATGAPLVKRIRSRWVLAKPHLHSRRKSIIATIGVSLAAMTIGAVLLPMSLTQSQYSRLPGEDRACVLLQSTLALDPGSDEAEQVRHSVLSSYLTLVKSARSSGDSHRASVYSRRAQSVLVGSWVHDNERRPKFC